MYGFYANMPFDRRRLSIRGFGRGGCPRIYPYITHRGTIGSISVLALVEMIVRETLENKDTFVPLSQYGQIGSGLQ